MSRRREAILMVLLAIGLGMTTTLAATGNGPQPFVALLALLIAFTLLDLLRAIK